VCALPFRGTAGDAPQASVGGFRYVTGFGLKPPADVLERGRFPPTRTDRRHRRQHPWKVFLIL